MAFPNTFTALTGPIPTSKLDENFGALLDASALTKGAGLVAYAYGLNYAAGTMGYKARETFSILDIPSTGADQTTRLQTAMSAARASGATVVFPQSAPTQNVSASIDVSGVHIVAYGRNKIHIQASSAQFDVLTSTGNTTLENLYVHGGWDGSTAGQSGDIFSIRNTYPAYPYNVHLDHCTFQYAKKRGVYWERSGYSSVRSLKVNACGLHAMEVYAPSGSDSATTIRMMGDNTLNDCPNGYSLKVTNGINMQFDGLICEYTSGIALAGNDNRSIGFCNIYSEALNGNKLFNDLSSAGIGLTFSDIFAAGAISDPFTNWIEVRNRGGHASMTFPALPSAGRMVSADSLQQTTATTGGVNVTVASITVPPGNWRIDATMQTLDVSSSVLVGVGCRITTNGSATGYANDTSSNFVPGADAYRNTPAGSQSDARLNCWWYYDNATTSAVTVYLRAFINISAGTIAYRGIITAARVV